MKEPHDYRRTKPRHRGHSAVKQTYQMRLLDTQTGAFYWYDIVGPRNLSFNKVRKLLNMQKPSKKSHELVEVFCGPGDNPKSVRLGPSMD